MKYICTAEEVSMHDWWQGPLGPSTRIHDGDLAQLQDCPEHDGLPYHEGPLQSGPDAGEERKEITYAR